MYKLSFAIILIFISLESVNAGSQCFIKSPVQKPVCTTKTCPAPVVQRVEIKPKIVEQKIEQTIVNKTDVVNNLIMPARLEPLRIAAPPPQPTPLTMRPFSFQNNMGPLPQQADPYQHPYVDAVCAHGQITLSDGTCVNANPFILNNVVTRRVTTTTSSVGGVLKTTTSSSAVQIDPQTGKATEVTPEQKSEDSPAPPPPSSTRYGY